jgi:hypothetical protein
LVFAWVLFILVNAATVNPNVLLELISIYRDWQEGKVQQISTKQVCLSSRTTTSRRPVYKMKLNGKGMGWII